MKGSDILDAVIVVEAVCVGGGRWMRRRRSCRIEDEVEVIIFTTVKRFTV